MGALELNNLGLLLYRKPTHEGEIWDRDDKRGFLETNATQLCFPAELRSAALRFRNF